LYDEQDPGGPYKPITIAAVAAEFGLGFIPGWDLIDVVRYGPLKNIDGDGAQGSNYIIASVSLVVLLADAGYLAGPAGFATNAVGGEMKVIVKRVPAEVWTALFRQSDDAVVLLRSVMEYIGRFPVPDNMDWTSVTMVKTWAIDMATGFTNQWNRILYSPVHITADDLALGLRVMHRNTRHLALSDEGAEEVCAYLRHGVQGETGIDNIATAIQFNVPANAVWPDESLDSITSAIASTYRRRPSGGGIPEASDILRVDEAVAAAVYARTSHYRTVIGPFIGEDHVIKSMNEFEALRFMRAENLAAEQVTAMNTIRAAMGMPVAGTTVTKVLPLSQGFANIQDGGSSLSGYFARQTDTYDATMTTQFIDRLRLDRSGGIVSQEGYLTFFSTREQPAPVDLIVTMIRNIIGTERTWVVTRTHGEDRSWTEWQRIVESGFELDEEPVPNEWLGEGLSPEQAAAAFKLGTLLRVMFIESALAVKLDAALRLIEEDIRGDFVPAGPFLQVGWYDLWEGAEHDEGYLFGRAFV